MTNNMDRNQQNPKTKQPARDERAGAQKQGGQYDKERNRDESWKDNSNK